MGREPWCTCGYIKLWHDVVESSGNSQHLTDWYTFAHVLDGFGFYLALWLVGRDWPLLLRLTLATALAVAWEVFENTDFVIDHYRTATIALGYRGDSIVNSVGDTLACILGFTLAARLPLRSSVALAAATGVVAAWVVRDDLTFMAMLFAPKPSRSGSSGLEGAPAGLPGAATAGCCQPIEANRSRVSGIGR